MAPINVHIKLYSILKDYGRNNGMGSEFTLQVEPGTTLDHIREQLGIPEKRIGRYLKKARPLQPDYVVADGDAIDILPPMISGG